MTTAQTHTNDAGCVNDALDSMLVNVSDRAGLVSERCGAGSYAGLGLVSVGIIPGPNLDRKLSNSRFNIFYVSS
jgi:hypothetical protein